MTEKVEVLKAMNTLVKALNDERAYYEDWIYTVPDCATDEDLEDLVCNPDDADDADDEVFGAAVESFKRCMSKYCLESGFYIEGKVY